MANEQAITASNQVDENGAVVGINFGNTNTSIAIITNEGGADCIANEDGERQIPSIVSFFGEEELVGSQAKSQLLRNAQNTVTYFRHLIGRPFKDIEAMSSPHKFQSCPLVASNDAPAYVLHHTEEPTMLSLSAIASRFLDNIRKSATDFLGRPVKGAVIAVPPSFTDAQKTALEDAAVGAGIKVLQIINEPTAAMLAATTMHALETASLENIASADKVVAVIDIGGTSMTTSVFSQKGGICTLLHSSMDDTLGGAAFDTVLVDFLAKEFQKATKVDIKTDKRGMVKLRLEAEQVKRALSKGSTTVKASVDSLSEGMDLHTTVNRTRFELLASKTLDAIMLSIQSALKHAGVEPMDVDEVLLVGGTVRIPKLQQRIRDLFYQPEPETAEQQNEADKVHRRAKPTNIILTSAPDELIACGCAIQASLIEAFDEKDVQESLHPIVTMAPHVVNPLGVLDGQGRFVPIITKDTPLPVRRTVSFNIPEGKEEPVYIPIYEGEHNIHEIAPPSKEEKPPATQEDDDDEFDDDDFIQETLKIPTIKATDLVAEVVLPISHEPPKKKGSNIPHSVEITLQVDAQSKLTIVAREVGVEKGNIVRIDATNVNA